jgi:hypothetical protein
MAWTAGDGPPDLTATHIWTPAGGGGVTTLNSQVTWPPTLPWTRIMRITGWRSAPESEDLREARTVGHGEIVYPSRYLGKTVAYECRCEAATVQSVSGHLTGIQRGFMNNKDEGLMTVTPYSGFGGGSVWTFNARALDFEADPNWEYNPLDNQGAFFKWGFILSLRMSNPYFYTGGVGYL